MFENREQLSQRLYILCDRDGDYVLRAQPDDVVRIHFRFIKDHARAGRFTYHELWGRNAIIGAEFTHGFGGGIAERIKRAP
jgi:hypothetical protein